MAVVQILTRANFLGIKKIGVGGEKLTSKGLGNSGESDGKQRDDVVLLLRCCRRKVEAPKEKVRV